MTVSIIPQGSTERTHTVQITVTHRCGHQVEQTIRPNTEASIRQVGAMYPCQDCKANRVEPIRFASGWGWRTGR